MLIRRKIDLYQKKNHVNLAIKHIKNIINLKNNKKHKTSKNKNKKRKNSYLNRKCKDRMNSNKIIKI